ncbi:lipoate--protein ligase [Eubacteriales bacterium OttesenSCG-928-N13]|nr:lipoate--protein ligase [Eubacteriales bacterium OttesenSCG-928-N13]
MITHARILLSDQTDPHHNLALEDALLTQLPAGQALLFLWQNRHTVVIGAGQNAWRECHIERLRDEGGTLARRSSGGGAVYHDMGNLNFSFVVPKDDYDVDRQLRVVLGAVQSLGINAEKSGRNDLTVGGRKFSGNAFRLMKHSALHHGTLLVDVDMDRIGRYLNVDPKKMQAKGVKSVPARVVNLSDMGSVTIDSMRDALITAFQAEYGTAETIPLDQAKHELDGLRARIAHYQSWDWNYGASPQGEVNLYHRFDWGGLELSFRLENGIMRHVQVFTDAMDERLKPSLETALEGSPMDADALAARVLPLNHPEIVDFLRHTGL